MKCMSEARMKQCPQCGRPVKPVTQSPDSPLNSDQFDASKAGDWYCEVCPDNGCGQKPICYWWDHELPLPHDFQI